MNDLDAKIRLQILVENYIKLGTKKDQECKEEAERVIGEIARPVINWLDEHGRDHQLTLRDAFRQLKPINKYFIGDRDFKFLFKQVSDKIVKTKKEEPVSQRDTASLTQIAFLLIHLEAVDYLRNVLGTGNLEPAIRKAIPDIPLQDKTNTLKKIRQRMNDYRYKNIRTGDKNAKSKFKPSKRLGDYDKVIQLLWSLYDNEINPASAAKIKTAINNAIDERETARQNTEKMKKGRLEKDKL